MLSLTNQTMVRMYTSPKVEMLEENGKYTDGGDFKPMKLAHHAADGALFGTYVPPTGSTITHYTAPTVWSNIERQEQTRGKRGKLCARSTCIIVAGNLSVHACVLREAGFAIPAHA